MAEIGVAAPVGGHHIQAQLKGLCETSAKAFGSVERKKPIAAAVEPKQLLPLQGGFDELDACIQGAQCFECFPVPVWVLGLVGFDHQPHISAFAADDCRRERPLKGMDAPPGVFALDPGVEVKTEAEQRCIGIEPEVLTRLLALLAGERLDWESW